MVRFLAPFHKSLGTVKQPMFIFNLDIEKMASKCFFFFFFTEDKMMSLHCL